MRLRKTNLDDLPQLKALWALGFGDTEQEIEAFFAISYPAATGFCAEEDGRLIAAAYALPQELAWGERTAKAAYLYAVTTHPDFRKQGVCRKLLAFAEKELKKRYFDCLVLVPATDALRAYYETMGFCTQKSDFLDDGPAPEARGVCEELGSHYGCACAHVSGDTLVVDEILPDGSVLPALLKKIPAASCRVRTAGGNAPFAMCKWLSEEKKLPDVYLAFDFG